MILFKGTLTYWAEHHHPVTFTWQEQPWHSSRRLHRREFTHLTLNAQPRLWPRTLGYLRLGSATFGQLGIKLSPVPGSTGAALFFFFFFFFLPRKPSLQVQEHRGSNFAHLVSRKVQKSATFLQAISSPCSLGIT